MVTSSFSKEISLKHKVSIGHKREDREDFCGSERRLVLSTTGFRADLDENHHSEVHNYERRLTM
jgi:hypothetical protein